MNLRAWAELLRLPALFTVPGDALAGAAATGLRPGRGTFLAIGSSLCLYEAGMALNDWADRDEDAVDRPHRPIPSGRVTPTAAFTAAVALTAGGLALASRAGRPALATATALAGTVWAYDLGLKRTSAGPVAMAAARGLDLLLGATATATGAGARADAGGARPTSAPDTGAARAAVQAPSGAARSTDVSTTRPTRSGATHIAGCEPTRATKPGQTAMATRAVKATQTAEATQGTRAAKAAKTIRALATWAGAAPFTAAEAKTAAGETSHIPATPVPPGARRTPSPITPHRISLHSQGTCPTRPTRPTRADRPGPAAAARSALPAAATLAAHTLAVTTVSRHETQGGSTGAPLGALATTLALGHAVAYTPHPPAGRRTAAAVGPPGTNPGPPGATSGLPGAAAVRSSTTLALGTAYATTAARPYLHAALNPSPPLTQGAVGGGIRALIPLQAALAARSGALGTALFTAALAPLARRFARKVSVT
ncbi:UbiA family prenyltransferase [Streptomyces flavofungini]|uniref:UbiA family prenyltransferase n=1 Tax=Streptomyces flavofungini TaxID=68200 RepID=UPI0025AF9EEF|nr:UbiA family prenyltransferase [Streptomyces flavofungini]WJV45210.1 UbiA family prenyltransferase [Streptomyces flavofungini]